jgi:GH35 family endo-1,4-beta-xylanase
MKNDIPCQLTRLMLAMTFALGLALLVAPAQAAAPESYRKLWRDPAMADRIDQSIEKHRKGDATVEVVDAAGKPVPAAKVELRQTGHEFLFGCNAFVLGQLKPEEMNRRYEDAFARVFNFATVPFYWEGTEPARGELRYAEGSRDIWRRPPPDRFLAFAASRGITLKGHPLLWHSYNPPWLPKDADELRELYRKRFQEIAGRYGGKIPIWDVVNESLVCPKTYPLYTPDRAYVAWAFAQASPLFPADALLMINEVTSYNFKPADKNPYFAQVKALLAQGLKVRGVGFQFHYFRRDALDRYLAGPDCDPGKMLDLYEKFGEFGLPLYVTEITIPSAGDGGDELQAEVVRDHYRLWFAAPRMAGITWWNLGDGTAVKGENEAKGGLLDGDLRPKSAYQALDKLINEEWKTRVQTQTDAQGLARFRGFFGKYKVTVTTATKTEEFEIGHKGAEQKPHRVTLGP